jgi:hypothetical protein
MSAENERAAVREGRGKSYGELVRDTFAAVDQSPDLSTRTKVGQPAKKRTASAPYQNSYKPQKKAKRQRLAA